MPQAVGCSMHCAVTTTAPVQEVARPYVLQGWRSVKRRDRLFESSTACRDPVLYRAAAQAEQCNCPVGGGASAQEAGAWEEHLL